MSPVIIVVEVGGTSIPAIVAAVAATMSHRKIAEVHVLVNNRLDEALYDIQKLKESVAYEKTQPPEDES